MNKKYDLTTLQTMVSVMLHSIGFSQEIKSYEMKRNYFGDEDMYYPMWKELCNIGLAKPIDDGFDYRITGQGIKFLEGLLRIDISDRTTQQ